MLDWWRTARAGALVWLWAGSVGIFGSAACSGAPDSVKALSGAQVENGQAFCRNLGRSVTVLKEYFRQQGEAKLASFEGRHMKNVADTRESVRGEAKAKSWEAARTAAEVASRLNALQTQLARDRADLVARTHALSVALDGLVTRCEKLGGSQAKLDEYLQLRRSEDGVNHWVAETLGKDGQDLAREVDGLAENVPKL